MYMLGSYNDDISRVQVRVSLEGWEGAEVTTFSVSRSVDQIKWEPVRGGQNVAFAGTSYVTVNDYEFTPGVLNYYKATANNGLSNTVSVTPLMDSVWIKFPGAPYLNRKVRLIGWDEIERQARSGVFEVSARRDPVTVVDTHSSRSTTIHLRTSDIPERESLDVALSGGLVFLLHVPTSSALPSMYVVPGSYTYRRPTQRSLASVFEVPIREVAKPGPSVYGSAGTWQSVLNEWSSWNGVYTDNQDWAELAELIGSPSDIIAS